MTAEPNPPHALEYRTPAGAGETMEPTEMTFWTRFYVGAMGGTVAAVVAAILSFDRLWLAALLAVLLSIPAFVMTRRAKSSGYLAGYWTIILLMSLAFAIVGPYLHQFNL